MRKKVTIIFSVILFFIVIATYVHAAGFAPTDGLVPVGCQAGCPCTLCDLYTLALNIERFLLYGIAIPIAAIAILYGGVMMMTSAGSEQKITAGKAAISNAIIGLALAFFAWVIINALLVTLTFQIGFGEKGTSLKNWFVPPECTSGGGKSCNTDLPVLPPGGGPPPGNQPPATCGTGAGICDPDETVANCAIDCDKPGVCGNGICDMPGPESNISTDPNYCARDCASGSTQHQAVLDRLLNEGVRVSSTKCGISGTPAADACLRACTQTETNCTFLGGISQDTVDKLIIANNLCGATCIIVTAGTEAGHLSHGPSNIVDVDYNFSAINALSGPPLNLLINAKYNTGLTCEPPGGGSTIVTCGAGAGVIHVEF
ncbi:MAG: pilin [Patescibacteria group bacterium]